MDDPRLTPARLEVAAKYLEGKTVRKVVIAGGASRLVSIVVS